MAGTVTHLVIANRILMLLPDKVTYRIRNESLFYCGNLAPDAVMARGNYMREMKLHTHFRDGIGEDELAKPENFAMYRRRFGEFIERFVSCDNPKDFELYFGYMTHIMADEIFILTVRDRHVELLKNDNPFPDYHAYFRQFGRDTDLNDWRVIEEGFLPDDITDILQKESDYEIEGLISNKELLDSRNFIIRKNFLTPHREAEEPLLVKYEENMAYIDRAVDYIVGTINLHV